jgi:hypothetical protein
MSGTLRTLDTDIIQVRKVYARTPQNGFIPSSHILISDGDGSTRWNSVSSIFEVSSFKTVKGNTATTFSADLYQNLLQVSTTGIRGVLESYVDPVTSTLMLSNYLPPLAISQGSVPRVDAATAALVPNAEFLLQTSGQSTLKFFGVGDIQFSTVTTQQAAFISISSFTSRGYSTISGETFRWRPTFFSSVSTFNGRPSFISSVPFVGSSEGWNWGSNLPLSTPATSQDMYFSSITFQMDHLIPYIDMTSLSSTRIFIDYNPVLMFSTMVQGTGTLIKEVSTFLQVENNVIPRRIFSETVNTNYMMSQQFNNAMYINNSNYFNTNLRFEVDAYQTVMSNYVLNNSNSVNYTIYHRLCDASSDGFTSGFSSVSSITNLTPKRGGLYINLINQNSLPPGI